MKIKVVIDEEFRGMYSGWPVRYLGILGELNKRYSLYIYAPGNTSLLRERFPNAWVCESTPPIKTVAKGSPLRFAYSLMTPNREAIYRPDFACFDAFKQLVKVEPTEFDFILYFGITAYITYHRQESRARIICDFGDSRIRSLKSKLPHVPALIAASLHMEMLYVRRIKKKLIEKSVVGLTLTDEDAREISASFQGRMVVVKNGVSAEKVKDSVAMRAAHGNKRMLFVGVLDFEPNILAVNALLTRIWPQLAGNGHGLKLDIVGRNPQQSMEELAASLKNVSIFGNVPSTSKYYIKAMFFVAPIYTGAGMKNKVLEALASGTPIITTREAAKGIDLAEPETCFFADTDDQFVDVLSRVGSISLESYLEMSSSCISLARRYAWSETVKPLIQVIEASSS